MAKKPEINLEAVCEIIQMARQFDVKEGLVEAQYGANPADEDFRSVLADSTDDAVGEELASFIRDLNEDEQCALVALAWTGRGDFTAADWDEAMRLARERHNNKTAEYLLGIPLLADYLTEGLNAFGLTCEA